MSATARYWMGLLMLCMAAIFSVGLGSLLQYRAIARHQAMSATNAEVFTVSLPPPVYRKASF